MKTTAGEESDAKSQTQTPGGDAQAKLQRPVTAQKRRRVLRACDECRREKIGCDGKLPCAHCKVYGYECTYNQPSNRGRNSGKYIEALETRLRKAEALLRITAPDLDLNDPRLGNATPEQMIAASRRATPRDEADESTAQTTANGKMGTEGADESLLGTMMENLGSLDIDDRGYWDYRGHSSSIIFLQRLHNQFGTMIDPSRPPFKAWPMSYIREGPALQLGSRPASNYPENRPPTSDLPSKECARILCRGGLQHTCSLLRFVHEPSFWAMFDRIYATQWNQMNNDEQTFVPLLYIVLAVGCCVADDADKSLGLTDFDDVLARGFHYFRASRRLIDITDCRDLTTLQAICFMILFLQSSAKLSICYSYIGLAQRAALRLGLHRSVAANFTPVERELRKRIFWGVRSMDVYVSTICGLPLTISDDDIDQEYPLEIDDEYITPSGILPAPPRRISSMVGANAHARLVDIMVKVLKYIYPVRISSDQARSGRTYMVSHSKICEIEAELDAWTADLPSPLQPGSEASAQLERMRGQLQINHAYVQWMLYRPFLHLVSNNSRSQRIDGRSRACASACLTAAKRIVHIVADMYKKCLINGSYWFAMHATYVSVLTLVFFVLENPHLATAEEDAVNDAFEGKDILAALAKDSVALRRCACLYSLFKYLPGKAKDNRQHSYQSDHPLQGPPSLGATTETNVQHPVPSGIPLEQPLPLEDDLGLDNDSSRAWENLIPHLFPASAAFPKKTVPATEKSNCGENACGEPEQSLEDFISQLNTTVPSGSKGSDGNIDYGSISKTNIPHYSQQNGMKPQVCLLGLQNSIVQDGQHVDAEAPPNLTSQDLSPASQGTPSTGSVSQVPIPPNDIWMNDIWMSDADHNGLSSIRTGLEMDIGLDDFFAHDLSASALDADPWGQWWDAGA